MNLYLGFAEVVLPEVLWNATHQAPLNARLQTLDPAPTAKPIQA